MKALWSLIAITSIVIAQESEKLAVYGNVGVGLSRGGYQESAGGTTIRLGATVGYYHILIKVDRAVNNEFTTFIPPEKISSCSYLFGLSLQPF